MRAREFVINIPITIRLDSNGEIHTNQPDEIEDNNEEQTMVPPLQQSLEMQKAALGKTSPIISSLLNPDEGPEL